MHRLSRLHDSNWKCWRTTVHRDRAETRACSQRRVWLTWPCLKNTHNLHTLRLSSVEPPRADQLRRPVTDGFILLINHLCAPPSRTRKLQWFRFTSQSPLLPPVPPPLLFSCVACLAVGLAACRKRSGDFCCALLEAARRGGSTRDYRKKCTCGGA